MTYFLHLKTVKFSYFVAIGFLFWKWHILIHFSFLKRVRFPYLIMTYFSFLEMPDFGFWNEHILEKTHFVCIWNWHIFLLAEKCYSGKKKVKLNGIVSARTTSKKLKMFVIGKSKIPWCFKNVKQLSCWYRGQQKASMNGKHFKDWKI